ncbi:MAG: hypothetical protein EOM44_14850 [Bacteroidia bacterium]|nr:hypothetical protein [Bacteroidia bacterium]NCC60859.1 hypothetical protein [Verrucomicrobiae bacterium]
MTLNNTKLTTAEYATYDGEGNLLSDGVWACTRDGENRLTKMVSTNLTKHIAFEYDYKGRRIAKKVWNNASSLAIPGYGMASIRDAQIG